MAVKNTGAQPSLIEAHSNIVAVAGTDVTMKCQTSSGDCSNVYWRKLIAQTLPIEVRIFRNNEIYSDYRDRYSVDSSSGCNLLIKNASPTDAGRFTCEYIKEISTVNELSLLIVLESVPECTARVRPHDGIAYEGDEVQFICELRFNAIEGASMTWTIQENASIYVKPNTNGKLLHSVVVGRSEIPSHECNTTFELPKNIRGLATNIPIGPSCTTRPIRPTARDGNSTRRDSGEQPTETSIGLKTLVIVIAVAVLLLIFSVVITRLIFKRKYGSVATGTKSGSTVADKKYQNLNRPTSQLNENGEISEHYDTIELYDKGYETIDEYSMDDPNYEAIQDSEYLDVVGESLDDNAEAEENDHSATDHDHQSEQTEANNGYQSFLV